MNLKTSKINIPGGGISQISTFSTSESSSSLAPYSINTVAKKLSTGALLAFCILSFGSLFAADEEENSAPSEYVYQSVVSGDASWPELSYSKELWDGLRFNTTGTLTGDSVSSFLFWWEANEHGNYEFRQQPSNTAVVPEGAVSITVDYQKVFGTPGSGPAHYYSWDYIPLAPNSPGITRNNLMPTNGYNDNYDFVVYGESQTRQTSGLSGAIDNQFYQQQTNRKSALGIDTNGGAIYLDSNSSLSGISNSTFVGNYIDTYPYDKDNNLKNWFPKGGAIANYGTIGNMTNVTFIGNYIEGAKSYGGAIFNRGEIGQISGNFIGNYAYASASSAQNTPQGGAISNASDDEDKTYGDANYVDRSRIKGIVGNFIGNYVFSDQTSTDTIGGAIANYGHIDYIYGTFIGNYASSPRTANSGAIRNYSKNNFTAIIGYSPELEVEKRAELQGNGLSGEALEEAIKEWKANYVAIDGVFIGNYAQGGKGSAWAGVMRNNGEIHGAIKGLYIGNYAIAEGYEGESNYYSNSEDSKVTNAAGNPVQHIGHARGGVFFNTTKADTTSDLVTLDNIEATFIDNYVQSTYSTAFGGAIFNRNATIANIRSIFRGNHAVSLTFEARGGALYNNYIYDKDHDSIKTSTIENIGSRNTHAEFTANYAQGKAAKGGAIFVANSATIKNIYADFQSNYAESILPDKDLYDTAHDMDGSVIEFYSLAQGGVLFVDNQAQTQNITGRFSQNYARTNGTGERKDNTKEEAQGGAIYLANNASIHDITADFLDNFVENKGENTNKVAAKAQGGAIYVAQGSTENITGNFERNEARSIGSGNVSEDVQGGAIYVSSQGSIQNIKVQTSTTAGTFRGFKDNVAKSAGGINGSSTKVNTQGGAIFVDEAATIEEIVADFDGNKVLSEGAGNISETVQGGAIYVNAGGKIQDITAVSTGFTNNIAKSTGTNDEADNAVVLAQGGAIYVSEGASTGSIYASFKNNIAKVESSNNAQEEVQGGAIYVAAKGHIGQIGDENARVTFEGNVAGLEATEDSITHDEHLTMESVRGGAIYVASALEESSDPEVGTIYKTGSIDNVYADFKNNSAISKGGTGDMIAYAQGGAIFVLDYSSIGHIVGDFEGNKAETRAVTNKTAEQSAEATKSKEWAHGGAIDVAQGGKISSITGNFTSNYVKNSGNPYGTSDKGTQSTHTYYSGQDARNEDANGVDVRDGDDMHAKGGALYIASGATVGDIISNFDHNYAEGAGQVRAGALFVSYSEIGEIGDPNAPRGDRYRFFDNHAYGVTTGLTYGGAVRFDGSMIKVLAADFIDNWTNGSGGAISLTASGVIYEITSDFIGNTAGVNGGAVDNLGQIGMRGYVKDEAGNRTSDYLKAVQDPDNPLRLETFRDATDANKGAIKNKANRWEYDGSFTGGFVNSNFLYNTIDGITYNIGARGLGGAIYTDNHLFITASGYQQTVMSGNMVKYGENDFLRSAIYVDDSNHTAAEGDYQDLVIYLVAKENGILRIDDNIRGAEAADSQFVLRLRGYSDRVLDGGPDNKSGRDTTGLIILNNRVEDSYSIMDDVTLYIGYQVQTWQDSAFLNNQDYRNYSKLTFTKDGNNYLYLIGDEGNDIVRTDKDGQLEKSFFLNQAGSVAIINDEGKTESRDNHRDLTGYHQSDVFRNSHLSVRSGKVALTDTTYGNRIENENYTLTGTPYPISTDKAYTEYLFKSLTAYGADYNYGLYGTYDKEVASEYLGYTYDPQDPDAQPKNDSVWDETSKGNKVGNQKALFAKFEFDIGLNKSDLYYQTLNNKVYYQDQYGHASELAYEYNSDGEKVDRDVFLDADGKEVHVVHQMAQSDVLTVFAHLKKGDDGKLTLDESNLSKGRVTLNGLTINNLEDGWKYTRYVRGGNNESKGGTADKPEDNYNQDVYVQLINYVLMDENGNQLTMYDKEGNVNQAYKDFLDMFETEDTNNLGWHLLRLSDQFDLVHDATAVMKGSDILADDIELATTVTKDDSIRLVNWRDHLAEWAEYEGSAENDATFEQVENRDKTPIAEKGEGDKSGTKHFYFDQSVYYLNRNINIVENPTEEHHEATDAIMWGDELIFEGLQKSYVLDLQGLNLLSLIIKDQNVRLQSFTLHNVQAETLDKNGQIKTSLMQNEGHLTLDTMAVDGFLTINNASYDANGNQTGATLTATGIMEINNTITTRGANKDNGQWGEMIIDDSTQVQVNTVDNDDDRTAHPEEDMPEVPGLDNEDQGLTDADLAGGSVENGDTPNLDSTIGTDLASNVTTDAGSTTTPDNTDTTVPDTTTGSGTLEQSYIVISGTVENQNITHKGRNDELVVRKKDQTYKDAPDYGSQELGTWEIDPDSRDTFTTNTYLDTTTKESGYTKTTFAFDHFNNNSLTMDGGAFNLGHMYIHRLQLRDFNIDGGAVFVNSVTIQLEHGHGNSYMGGIDANDSNYYAGSPENPENAEPEPGTTEPGTPDLNDAAMAATPELQANEPDSGTDGGDEPPTTTDSPYTESTGVDKGLIWLQRFTLAGTSDQKVIHVKFVDDQVGYAVKDGMGVANGSEVSGKRYMVDGKGVYTWEVTYNDVDVVDDGGMNAIVGMYTLKRMSPTPEVQVPTVTDLTGSYVSMMQVYNYSFEHADLYSANINNARLSTHYAGISPAKGKDSYVDPCPPTTVGLRSGMWLHTYSSTETMPLNNGPEVKTTMYGGLVGGDTRMYEHNYGWASVYSLYGGYLGSTQSYDTVRIKQNGAAVGATATFYRQNLYAAVTASLGTSTADATGRNGKESFNILMGGAAARVGYNIPLDNGRYVLQPTMMVSYTFFSTGDYTNAAGARINSDATTVLQLHPFVKLIKNTDCTWKPYATLGYVYDAFSNSHVKAEGMAMPSMSIDPYVEYSVGAQRTYNDSYTIYGQITGRNGGRNGAEASAGIRWTW